MRNRTVAFYFISIQIFGVLIIFLLRFFDTPLALPDQIFYVGILISTGYLWVERRKGLMTGHLHSSERILVKTVFTLLILFVFLTIPLQVLGNIDRSRSLYMFGWIECAPKSASKADVFKQIENNYGKESLDAFIQRVGEQEQRNLVTSKDEKYVTTYQGHIVFQTAKVLAKVFHLDGWYTHDIWSNPKCLGR